MDGASRRTAWRLPAAMLAVVSSLVATGRAADDERPAPERPPRSTTKADEPALAMTPAVACLSIAGLEDYEPLPGAALTSDEKLLVYYRPLNYRLERNGATSHIHLVQDGQIRRRGEKAVLMVKAKLLDYDWKSDETAYTVYFRNTIALKGLKPGEYDYDITLHDLLAPGTPTARQTLHFRVIPPGPRNDQGEAKPSADRPTSP